MGLGDVGQRDVECIAQPLECFKVVFPRRRRQLGPPFPIALGVAKATLYFAFLRGAVDVAICEPVDEAAQRLNGERVRRPRTGAGRL